MDSLFSHLAAIRNNLFTMFGFIWTQPIYRTLHALCVVQILAMWVTYVWADNLMQRILQLSAEESTATMMGIYFTNFATLVAIFWKAANELRKSGA